MGRDVILYFVAVALTLGLLIRRVIIAQAKSPENDDTVARGYEGRDAIL